MPRPIHNYDQEIEVCSYKLMIVRIFRINRLLYTSISAGLHIAKYPLG